MQECGWWCKPAPLGEKTLHVAPWPRHHQQRVHENPWCARVEPEEDWTHTLLVILYEDKVTSCSSWSMLCHSGIQDNFPGSDDNISFRSPHG